MSDNIINGTITKKRPDGTEAQCAFLIDLDEGTLVQVGGDAEIVAEDIDLIIAMMTGQLPDPTDEGDTEHDN